MPEILGPCEWVKIALWAFELAFHQWVSRFHKDMPCPHWAPLKFWNWGSEVSLGSFVFALSALVVVCWLCSVTEDWRHSSGIGRQAAWGLELLLLISEKSELWISKDLRNSKAIFPRHVNEKKKKKCLWFHLQLGGRKTQTRFGEYFVDCSIQSLTWVDGVIKDLEGKKGSCVGPFLLN